MFKHRTTHQEEQPRDNERKFPRRLATIVAVLAAASALALAPGASADPAPPTLNALHAFVGDPLFGLDTPQGTLFGIKPDEQTAVGSSKKLWLLDIAAHALAQGKVHLDDQVTITKFEAGIGGSVMADVNGAPLEEGEVVKFGDLIRGMMYPSGNNATYAVARHVAQGYLGPAADWKSAVAMMNGHAAALGQTATLLDFTPYHDDDLTTARELAEEFQHGLQDPYFAKVVGFTGTYTATTQGPNGPKTYMWTWGRGYPGWEGEKGGSSPQCNGPNAFCVAAAATRIGRRVVIGGSQMANPDLNTMLDYGFASIFHPDPRGTSVSAGVVDRHDLDCFASNRAITATLPPKGPVKLALWNVNVDASTLTKLTEASLPGSENLPGVTGDVAVSRLPSGEIILATRQATEFTLSRWSINRAGGLTLESGIQAGTATTMALQPVYGDAFLTAVIEPGGDLVLKSWRLQGTGLVNLDTHTDASRDYTEVAIAGPLTVDVLNGHRAVTAALDGTRLYHHVWAVDQATGAISLLGTDWMYARSNVTISPFFVNSVGNGELFPPVYYATAHTNKKVEWWDDDRVRIRFIRIDATGKPVFAGNLAQDDGIPPGGDNQTRLAPLGTGGLMSTISDTKGNVRLTAWDAPRSSKNQIWAAQAISQYDVPGAASELCRLHSSTHAEGDYVTATRDLDGQLRLRAYRVGDRPY